MKDLSKYIVVDEKVLGGKPTIKGTRLSVEFILKLLAEGWSEAQILENYPRLTREALQTVYTYLYRCYEYHKERRGPYFLSSYSSGDSG